MKNYSQETHMKRRSILTLAFAQFAFSTRNAVAATFPERPVRIVVPFPPGGSPDVVARLLAEHFASSFKQPFIVENRPGASGNLGSATVAQAPADGHVLLLAPNTVMTANPSLYKKMPFRAEDFEPISMAVRLQSILVARKDSEFGTLPELVRYAKKNPGRLTFGSAGNGSPQHIAFTQLSQLTGIKVTHVPYRGAVPAVTDLLGGQIDAILNPANSVVAHVKTGRIRALAVSGDARLPDLPYVPTFVESGILGFNHDTWLGLFSARGTPEPVLQALADESAKFLRRSDVRAKLIEQGIVALGQSSRKNLAAAIAKERETTGRLLRAAGVEAE
jgi:tripartite-type tricarboxylate transporter receptor subunit TctC